MAIHEAAVKKALPSQQDLQDHAEHCSLDPDLLTTISCAVGQQVRIKRNASDYALFTISERHPEQPGDVARVGLAGRRRLGTGDEFEGVLDTQVPHPTLPEDEAEAAGELIEQLDDDDRHQRLIVIAPHGGAIERHTDDQAERVATRLAAKGVSAWRCKGWKRDGGAFDRWHITSTDINEASFPGLRAVIARRFTYAVAFHGFDEPLILIGGGAPPELKEEVREAIAAALAGCDIEVRIATADDGFGGDDERNIVNRLTAGGTGGIQIEQSLEARRQHWEAIADAVAAVYDRQLPGRPRPWPDAIAAFLGRLRKVLGRLVTRLSRRSEGS